MKLASALVAAAVLGASAAHAADDASCTGHPALRPGLDRHHLDERHRQHAARRARLRARGQDPVGADRLRGDEEGRDRRLPRQLDAGAAALPRRPRRRQGGRGHRPEPRGREVHPRRPDRRGDRARRRRLQGSRRPRRRLRREDLRHRDRGAGEPEPAEDDRRRRLRPRQVDARRVGRAGDARPGHARREGRRRHRLPRLGAAPDEHRPRAHLPLRRRRLLRPRLRRRHGLDPRPHRLGRGCPNAAQFFKEPRLRRRDGEPDDGPDPRRRREARRRGRGVDQGEPRPPRRLARRTSPPSTASPACRR